MQDRSIKQKRPRDPNQLAKFIVDLSTGNAEPPIKKEKAPDPTKNAAAVALGRLGGLKGGPARTKALTKERRSEIGKMASAARWGKQA